MPTTKTTPMRRVEAKAVWTGIGGDVHCPCPMSREIQRRLIGPFREVSTLDSAASLLSWDQQTFMPKKVAELRSAQSSLMARMVHEKFTVAVNW